MPDATPDSPLQARIEALWDGRDALSSGAQAEAHATVQEALALLDSGERRVAEPGAGGWLVNEWLKKAVLLSFRLQGNQPMPGAGGAPVFDKVPMKTEGWGENRFAEAGFRAVPGAVVRRSAYIAPGVVLMPCFVNVGAYVEPLQANPVVIEDDCFIGARSEVAEGVIVERGSVLSMGVFIGASTKIIDRTTGEVFTGRVPAYSVVVPGSLPGKPLPDGSPGPALSCAVIVKRVDERTRAKTGINELLRD